MAKKKANSGNKGKNSSASNTRSVKQKAGSVVNGSQNSRGVASVQQASSSARTSSSNHIRNIVLAILLILVIAVVVVVVFVFSGNGSGSSNSGSTTGSGSGLTQSGDTQGDGSSTSAQPIILSSEGVGVRNENAPDVTLYFDYSCHACAQVDDLVFDLLLDDVEDGKYNLLLQPVNTIDMAYHPIATQAALLVYQYEPENFVELHGSLMAYFWDAYQNGDGSVVTNAEPSLEAVQLLAEQAGVSQEIIDQLDSEGALEYLEASTTSWVNDTEAEIIEGRENNATPEVVVNNVSIRFSGASATDIYENFLESLRDAGLDV